MKSYGGNSATQQIIPERRVLVAVASIEQEESITVTTSRGATFVLHRMRGEASPMFHKTFPDKPQEPPVLSIIGDLEHSALYECYTILEDELVELGSMTLQLMDGQTEQHCVKSVERHAADYRRPQWKTAGRKGIKRQGKPKQQ